MATIILKGLGKAIDFAFFGGVPIAETVLTAAGAYVDSRILAGQFGPEAVKPPSFGDFQVQTAEEGAPVSFSMGSQARMGCAVLWMSPITRVTDAQGGGCGGGGDPGISESFFVDVAVALAQPPSGTSAVEASRLWADGRLFYDEHSNLSLGPATNLTMAQDNTHVTTALVHGATNTTPILLDVYVGSLNAVNGSHVEVSGVTGNTGANGLWTLTANPDDGPILGGQAMFLPGSVGNGNYAGGGVARRMVRRQKVTSPNGGVDLSKLRSGRDATVSGAANSTNNGTYRCLDSGIDVTTGVSFVTLDNFTCVAEGTGASVTITQTIPKFSPALATAVTFHDGSPWQLPDSLIESYQGIGKVPGFREIAYVVIQRLALDPFGQRVPHFNGLLQTAATFLVKDAVAALLTRAGYDVSEWDASTLTQDMLGYTVRGPEATIQSLGPVALANDVISYQSQGRLNFVKRRNASSTTIAQADLAAHEAGGDAPRRSRVRDVRARALPTEIQVNFIDPTKGWQNGMEPYRVADSHGDSPVQVQTLMTMTAQQAQDVARRLAWIARANAQTVVVKVPPSYLALTEGALAVFTDHGRTWTVLATKVDWGHDGVIVVEGPSDENTALDISGSSADGGSSGDGYNVPLELDLQVVDVASFRPAHAREPGVYYAISQLRPSRAFRGATLYESPNGVDFAPVARVDTAAVTGRCSTVLGGGAGPYGVDSKNTVDVEMYGGTLVSVSDARFLELANLALVGDEVVAFRDATLTGTANGRNVYRLSTIMRGLRDTEEAIGTHGTNERFVLVSGGGLRFREHSVGDYMTTRYFKAVSAGASVLEATLAIETLDCMTVRPFSPVNVYAQHENSGADLRIFWERQTRQPMRVLNSSLAPVDEPVEQYEIEFMSTATSTPPDATELTVLRMVTILPQLVLGQMQTPHFFVYTGAMCDANYSAGHRADPKTIQVYQVGEFAGRGRRRRVTVG